MIKFLIIARGSTSETKYFLRLCKDLKYIGSELFSDYENNLNEIGKMINGLIKSIRLKTTNN